MDKDREQKIVSGRTAIGDDLAAQLKAGKQIFSQEKAQLVYRQ
jgi:hypothetical protein